MVVVAAILYATLNSDPVGADDLPQIPHLDKLIHAIMFGGLFSAIMFDRMRSHCSDSLAIRIMIAAVCVVCGAVDEIAQNAAAEIYTISTPILPESSWLSSPHLRQ